MYIIMIQTLTIISHMIVLTKNPTIKTYLLAKRIFFFVTDPEKVELRLNELKIWLKSNNVLIILFQMPFTMLKVVSGTFWLVYFLSLKESTCETRKIIFCFTSKALFVLEKIKFQNFRFSNFMTSSNA